MSASCDTELGGIPIPKGALVVFSRYSVHHTLLFGEPPTSSIQTDLSLIKKKTSDRRVRVFRSEAAQEFASASISQ